MDDKKTLTHAGVLGMKWGRRKRSVLEGHGEVRRTMSGKLMAKDGTIATTRRGKLIPKTATIKGRQVEINGRATSAHIQAKVKGLGEFAKTKWSNISQARKDAAKITALAVLAGVATYSVAKFTKAFADEYTRTAEKKIHDFLVTEMVGMAKTVAKSKGYNVDF